LFLRPKGVPVPLIDESDMVPYPDGALNRDHRELIATVNRFYSCLCRAVADDGDATPARVQIGQLERQCAIHFRREEGYLQRLGYPQLTQHRIAHRRFEGLVHQFKVALTGNTAPADILRLVEENLSVLLIQHINEADQAAALFAAGLPAPPDP